MKPAEPKVKHVCAKATTTTVIIAMTAPRFAPNTGFLRESRLRTVTETARKTVTNEIRPNTPERATASPACTLKTYVESTKVAKADKAKANVADSVAARMVELTSGT